jgi:hypothetical protein
MRFQAGRRHKERRFYATATSATPSPALQRGLTIILLEGR